MTKPDKILTPDYLDWHAKLTGLPSVLTDRIRSSLYKKYKKETGYEPWQLSEDRLLINSKPENKVSYLSSSEQCEPITFKAKPDPELIIKSVLEHFSYLKFGNSFRGIDNYDFTLPQPWSSPCPICDGKHGNYGLHGEWYTRATALLRRIQSLSFLPLQAKLRTWPSLIHDGCVPQARHAHTYSDTKDALKTGIRNVKENISEGAKTDLSAWKTIKWLGTGILFISFDYSFASWYNHHNEKNLIRAFEYGSCPEPEVNRDWLIHREEIIKKLRRILEPTSDHSSYHVVVGNHGTGKTTVIRQCARDVGKGVIYVDVPPILNNFVNNLAKAIGFKEYVSITESLMRKILGSGVSDEQPRLSRVLDAFERGALKYKAKNGKPPVLILDNISKLGQKNANVLEDLQDIAKLYADQSSCIIVFVSSEGTAPRMMMQRSSWSRAEKKPIVIEDLTSKETFNYLHSKLGIEEKVTNQLIQLLGGRIRDLKEYGNMINRGETFEEVRKIVFGAINHNFHQARMMKGERNHTIGEVIVQKLVKNKKIHFDTFIELVNNEQIADELLQANVFSYNPESGFVTFQSHATEVFVKENPELKSKEVFT